MHGDEDKQKSPELFPGHATSGSIGSKKVASASSMVLSTSTQVTVLLLTHLGQM